MFISTNGMVQRTAVRGINRYGRSSQGVKVMNMKDDDAVSAVARVVDSDGTSATVEEGPLTEDQTADADAMVVEPYEEGGEAEE